MLAERALRRIILPAPAKGIIAATKHDSGAVIHTECPRRKNSLSLRGALFSAMRALKVPQSFAEWKLSRL